LPAAPRPASALREAFRTGTAGPLEACYGADPELHAQRCEAACRILDRFLAAYGDLPCFLYRVPGRLSLNPHSDHQGAWVPYGLHRRELLAVVAPTADDRVEAVNADPSFAERLSFSVAEEAARDPEAWQQSWDHYLSSAVVKEEVARNRDAAGQTTGRRATLNYLKGGVLRLAHAFPGAALPGLRLALHGDIPQGGGQSSSSTLVVLAALALAQLAGLPVDRRRLAELCGEGEWYVGTRGGSGDHAAMLLGTRRGLAHLCFTAPVGVRGVRYSPFPSGYRLVLCNSLTRSYKSAAQKLLFNTGIFAYRFAYLALRDAMAEAGCSAELLRDTTCLGDLHAGRLSSAELYRLLLRLRETTTPQELAARYPHHYPAAARACFDTEDPERLPQEIPLRGAALYGLGRVDRGQRMPELLEAADPAAMARFGALMSITHDGDRLYSYHPNGDGTLVETPFTAGRQRLADGALGEALRAVEAGEERPLCDEPGYYGASIRELDLMVDLLRGVEGVLGAGLMGAGGGGYVLALAREEALPAMRRVLEEGYYAPRGLQPEVEPWHPTGPACRLA
jgi:N-acetylgalactosamine kinase